MSSGRKYHDKGSIMISSVNLPHLYIPFSCMSNLSSTKLYTFFFHLGFASSNGGLLSQIYVYIVIKVNSDSTNEFYNIICQVVFIE